ncbi:MAG: hypothetical protein JWP12_517 [Bacteroidetes bacterium]|nr:hypothetical protein [Bacteroidota bacterium]
MKNKKRLFSKRKATGFPLQFLFVEKLPLFDQKTKTLKLHSKKGIVSDQQLVAAFYKPISKLF